MRTSVERVREGFSVFLRHRKRFVVLWSVGACVVLLLLPFDDLILEKIRTPKDSPVHEAARMISDLTDLHRLPLWIAGGMWLIGLVSRKRSWRRSAWACVLAACVAGMAVNVFRGGLGRARPNQDAANDFYGPSFSYAYQGFPSGHTGHMFGFATSLVFTSPPVGIPMVILASETGWSRMELGHHRPSDVAAGIVFGVTWGMMIGLATRARNREEENAVEEAPEVPASSGGEPFSGNGSTTPSTGSFNRISSEAKPPPRPSLSGRD